MTKSSRLAQELLKQARTNEPAITKDIRQIAKSAKVKVVGLENRFKSEESLTRKLLTYSESGQLPLTVVAKRNNDTLRYTYLVFGKDCEKQYDAIRAELSARNYRIGKVFNAWELEGKSADSGYRGINITVISSQKQRFELQLHTKGSFDLKTETHALYEELRNPLTSETRKSEISKIVKQKAKKLKRPTGV